MSINDKIKEKLKYIKTLAEKGVGGEKENADKLLKDLCKKYNILESELDHERVFTFNLGEKGSFKFKLGASIIVKTLGDIEIDIVEVHKQERIFVKVKIKTTPEIFIDIKTLIDILHKYRNQQLELFDHAFMIKHDLILNTVSSESLSPEELEKFRKIYELSNNIDKKEIFREIDYSKLK